MAKSRGNGQGSVTKIKDTKGKIKYQIRVNHNRLAEFRYRLSR